MALSVVIALSVNINNAYAFAECTGYCPDGEGVTCEMAGGHCNCSDGEVGGLWAVCSCHDDAEMLEDSQVLDCNPA